MKAKRRFNIWLWVLLCVPCLLASCDHNVHDGEDEGGLSVSLTWADEAKVMKGSTNWHLGYGADLQVGYQLTSCLKLGIYSGLTRLTGERMDGMPEHLHKNNFVWESGVRLGFSLPFNNHQQ